MSPNPQAPAPGSRVAGAPPALRRPLTERDGVSAPAERAAPATPAPSSATAPGRSVPSRPTRAAHGADDSRVSSYLTALGLLSAAVAIEVFTRRQHRRSASALRLPTNLKEN